ncbi:MAG: PilN domain-containing protein [Marinisporobacter sp.]|jgi:Tfp pilus assembly protein PilN|nr:PilN domain-containing protein [Marinisporobacter sp.]
MRDINLLDTHVKTSGNSNHKNLWIIIVCILMILLGSAYAFLEYSLYKMDQEKAEIDSLIQQKSVVEETKEEIRTKTQKIEAMSTIIDTASRNAVINTKMFQVLAANMPASIFLSDYSFNDDGQINLMGESSDNDSMAFFIYKLKQTNLFEDVRIKSIQNNKNEEANKENYNFVIDTKVIVDLEEAQ